MNMEGAASSDVAEGRAVETEGTALLWMPEDDGTNASPVARRAAKASVLVKRTMVAMILVEC